MNRLMAFIHKIEKTITNTNFIAKHRTKPSYFTRTTAKMTFDKLATFLLTLPRQSAQIAINRFIKEKGYKFTMDKQSLFEAREKFSHTTFIDLNNNYFLKDYAYTTDFKTFHKYRVLAVDGCVFDVPAQAKNFGTSKTNGEPSPKAQGAAFVDVLNKYILHAHLEPYGTGETNIVNKMINNWVANPKIQDLFVFDRGFFSRKLVQAIMGCASFFLFRVHSHCLVEVNQANQSDQMVVCRQKGQTDFCLRVINYVLPNGEVEKLVTNIFDSAFSVEVFGELYRLRWGVETCFRSLKSCLEIEDFSSAKVELILQDFYASVFVYNLTTAAAHEAEAVEFSKSVVSQKRRKYVYEVNRNVAVSVVRGLLIESFCEEDLVRRAELFRLAMNVIASNEVPIRPGRSFEHNVKHKSLKYPLNKKSAL